MKRLILILIGLLPLFTVTAQKNNVVEKARSIKVDDNYISGEGFGQNYDEAVKQSLNDLMTKISVKLTSNSDLLQKAENVNGEATYVSNLTSSVSTYSQGTLTNTNTLTLATKPEYHVFTYISRDELNKIYELRQAYIESHIGEAMRNLEKGKIDVTLSRLYWALALVKSLQYPEKSTYKYNGETVNLLVWLPNQIEEILENLSVGISEYKDNKATLFFTYNGNSIKSIEYEYWDGQQYSMPHKAKDGIGEIYMRPGTTPQNVRIRYVYNNGAQSQSESLQNIVDLFGDAMFANADVRLCTDDNAKTLSASKETAKEMTAAVAENNEIGIDQIKNYKEYEKIMQKVIKGIESKRLDGLKTLFTDEGWDMMTRLIHYGQAKLLGHQEYSIYMLNDGRVTCRSLTMSFAFPNNHKTFTEDVVFTFDTDKKIEGVTFGLGTTAKDDVFNVGINAEWSETSMLAIVDFLENYKTAFALKRTDYLESIFDDNAYIVAGHVVKKAPAMGEGMKANLSNDVIEYTRYTKNEYINRLKSIFAKNEFVNLQFADNDVQKMGRGGELFGIQIHQDYYSSHYGDTGYLFLIIDINDPQQPIIKVRTWQPERNPNIHNTLAKDNPDYGIITAGDF